MSILIKSKFKAGNVWLVDYVEQLACGCGYSQRKTIRIEKKKEPTDQQIRDEIKNQGENI